MERLAHFLASRQLALFLFPLLCLSLIPGTLEKENFHLSGLSRIIIGCMGLNLLFCTMERVRTLSRPVLILHAGAMLTLIGATMSAFGYVATVNIYEGTAVDTVYRWDLEGDVPLGVTVAVKKISVEYHPVPIKVGVLKGQEKVSLHELRTGKSFEIGPYTVTAEEFDVPTENLRLSVFQGGILIGSTDTEGTENNLPAEFPYSFKLVAFRDPVMKKVGVDLQLTKDSRVVEAGTVEANSPLEWNGLYFYNTNLDEDEYGNVYAGIQIVRDPGRPVVFAGFGVIMTGSLLWVYKKFHGYRHA
jgi:hypothetical protein